MNCYGRQTPARVEANAAQLKLFVALLTDKQLKDPEAAFRLAGPTLYNAFHGFNNTEILEAVREAEERKSRNAVLVGIPHASAEEAEKKGWIDVPLPAPTDCVCGEPLTLGSVHRSSGPCFVYQEPVEVPVEIDEELEEARAEGLTLRQKAEAQMAKIAAPLKTTGAVPDTGNAAKTKE